MGLLVYSITTSIYLTEWPYFPNFYHVTHFVINLWRMTIYGYFHNQCTNFWAKWSKFEINFLPLKMVLKYLYIVESNGS